MKRNVLTLLCCIGAMLVFQTKGTGQTLIHYWHFNDYNQGAMYTPTINGIVADYTDLAGSNPNILYKSNTGTAPNTYIDSLQPVASDRDTLNARMGELPGAAIRARNPSDSMKLYFYIPTTNFKNIVLKYATELSSLTHGMLVQNFDYSTDGGTNWKTSGLSETSDAADTIFKLVTVSFNDTTANNNANLVFRITFSGNDTGTQGNNRFDNVTVEGDSIGSTTDIANLMHTAAGYILFPNPVANSLEVTTTMTGDKSVMITNATGHIVYTGCSGDTHVSINTSGLESGNYFITIRENTSGKVSKLKFIKL